MLNFGRKIKILTKTLTVQICTDKIDLQPKNRYCSDQILGMTKFPEFEGNFPEFKEQQYSEF